MKIVKLKGGLGNQMFQYAYAKLLECMNKEDVRLDFSAFSGLENDMVRVPRIAKFRLSLSTASQEELKSVLKLRHSGNSQSFKYRVEILVESKINRNYFFEPSRAYIPPEKIQDYSYYDGYWQSWRYVEQVKDILAEEFVPNYELSENTKAAKNVMENQEAVFVGVRKGDFSEEKDHYGSFDSTYYQKAMAQVEVHVENPIYYVFSNDIAWCKENIDWGKRKIIYREKAQQTNDFEELILMSSCKHAIIVNSSYHWWGAQLIKNPDKKICCPGKWFFDDKPIDIIPPGWTCVE